MGKSRRIRGVMSSSVGRKRPFFVQGDENVPAELRGDEG